MKQETDAEAAVMRGIAARYARKAAAERRETQEAYKAEHAPAPSAVTWRPGPAPRAKKPTAIEKHRAEMQEFNRRAWARRHPELATELRGMRKERAQLLQRYGKAHDGTPETLAHAATLTTREGSLARMWREGSLSDEQLGSAVAIARVHARIGADVAIATASLETRIDGGRLGPERFFEKLGAVRAEVAYTRWRSAIGANVALVLDIVGGTDGLVAAAQHHRMGHRKARRILTDALDRWPAILGAVAREVDDDAVIAAWAELA